MKTTIKLTVLLFAFFIKSQMAMAQNCSCCLLSAKIDSLAQSQNHKAIITLFDSLAKTNKPTLQSFSYAVDACLATKNEADLPRFVTLAIKNQDFNSLGNLQYNYPEIAKHLDINIYKNNFDSLSRSWDRTFNKEMVDKIDGIIIKDQYIRELYNSFLNGDSATLKALAYIMEYTDSANEQTLQKIVLQHGKFTGVSDIGKSRMKKLNIIMVHFINKMDIEFYKPYIRAEIVKNNLHPTFLPQVIDRYRSRFGMETLYGCAVKTQNDSTFYYPIENIEKVEERRQYFCLPNLLEEQRKDPKIQLPANYPIKTNNH